MGHISPSPYPARSGLRLWLATRCSTGPTASKATALEAGRLTMLKRITSSTTVLSPLPIAQAVDSLTLEWQPGRYVLIHPVCMRIMSQFTKEMERNLEAGGIFLGSYRGKHIEITAATEPLPLDRRERYMFDRRDPGHQALAESAWRKSGRTITYTGEWHTHPEEVLSPSIVDLANWRSLMKSSENPLVFFILGWARNWYGIGYEGRILQAKPI